MSVLYIDNHTRFAQGRIFARLSFGADARTTVFVDKTASRCDAASWTEPYVGQRARLGQGPVLWTAHIRHLTIFVRGARFRHR